MTGLTQLESAGNLARVSELSTRHSQPAGSLPRSADTPFSDLLTETIGNVNRLEDQARTAIGGLITGKGVDVHEAMIAGEKASMAFEMALALRNKAVQSYQTIMSMQF